jgi:hypothetical protein
MKAEVAGSRFGRDMAKPLVVRENETFAMAVPTAPGRPYGPLLAGVG